MLAAVGPYSCSCRDYYRILTSLPVAQETEQVWSPQRQAGRQAGRQAERSLAQSVAHPFLRRRAPQAITDSVVPNTCNTDSTGASKQVRQAGI
jgi:hypothetical protein